MEGDRKSHKQERPYSTPASLYFNYELKNAIEKGSLYDTIAGLNQQEPNHVTEAISNHLVARSFVVEQKSQLVGLFRDIAEVKVVAEAINLVDDYTAQLRDRFEVMFVAEDGEEELSKLSGDSLFREVLQTPEAGRAAIARRIAEIDIGALLPPYEVLGGMEFAQESITDDLWDGVQNMRENGVYPDTLEAMQDAVALQIETVDEALVGNLPRSM